ncbi:hypothetical protein [Solibacillus sp. FSL W7-1324]|uniref:hypothetical protein n=1 Tax=Solibacillus sp. FSL W7-1324 TaxID=2921701 RepID=UPI0030F7BD9C
MLMSILIVSGCVEVTTTSISIEKNLPKKIEKILQENSIDKENLIQLFSNGKDTYYIVYETNNRIDDIPGYSYTFDSEVTINISEGEEADKISRYIFKLTSNINYKTINLKLNGNPASFDVVTHY